MRITLLLQVYILQRLATNGLSINFSTIKVNKLKCCRNAKFGQFADLLENTCIQSNLVLTDTTVCHYIPQSFILTSWPNPSIRLSFFPYKENEMKKFLYHDLDCFLCHWKCSKSEMFCILLREKSETYYSFEVKKWTVFIELR